MQVYKYMNVYRYSDHCSAKIIFPNTETETAPWIKFDLRVARRLNTVFPEVCRTVFATYCMRHWMRTSRATHTHSQIMCDVLHKQLIGLISWQVTYILLRCTPSFSATDQPRVSAPRENHPLWVTSCPRDISSYETHNMAAWLNNPSHVLYGTSCPSTVVWFWLSLLSKSTLWDCQKLN